MALNNSKQSTLEIKGIDERHKEIVRSNYNKQDSYDENHNDAISDPNDDTKIMGKGTNNGGHQHYVPDPTQKGYNYSSLNTTDGGGAYDIHGRNGQGGRNRLLSINIYNKTNRYDFDSVDTSANIDEGQYIIKA